MHRRIGIHHLAEPGALMNLDDGTKIYPRGLNINYGNDDRRWKISKEEKDKSDVAELVRVSWLDVSGKIPVTESGKYEIVFNVSMDLNSAGWDEWEVLLSAKAGNQTHRRWFPFTEIFGRKEKNLPTLEIEVKVEEGKTENICFSMFEGWTGSWKTGLVIHHVFVKNP